MDPVRSSGSEGRQPRQITSFFFNSSSAARLMAPSIAVHSFEYGFSFARSASLGELSPDATVSLVV
jgi:hypothetical protein